MTSKPALIVFSDLDGTLLDHDTYAWHAAKPALDALARLGCPVILASSKTAEEIEILQVDMGLAGWPAIVENGAGLIGLDEGGRPDGREYARIRGALDRVPPTLRALFSGFGDMSVPEVSKATGLDEASAQRAKARCFSEPGIWRGADEDLDAFIGALADHGLSARRGGRFLTLSFGATKADQMDRLITRFQPAHSMALGDAPNDVEMLERADFGAVIHNPHSAPLPRLPGEETGRIQRTKEAGPQGWCAAIQHILDHLGLDRGDLIHG